MALFFSGLDGTLDFRVIFGKFFVLSKEYGSEVLKKRIAYMKCTHMRNSAFTCTNFDCDFDVWFSYILITIFI